MPRFSEPAYLWTHLPQEIYQLARELPPGGSPVGSLMQRVRDLCIHQNAKIRPQDLGGESADDARSLRLDQLESDAEELSSSRSSHSISICPRQILQSSSYIARDLNGIDSIRSSARSQSRRLNEVQRLTKTTESCRSRRASSRSGRTQYSKAASSGSCTRQVGSTPT